MRSVKSPTKNSKVHIADFTLPKAKSPVVFAMRFREKGYNTALNRGLDELPLDLSRCMRGDESKKCLFTPPADAMDILGHIEYQGLPPAVREVAVTTVVQIEGKIERSVIEQEAVDSGCHLDIKCERFPDCLSIQEDVKFKCCGSCKVAKYCSVEV